MRITLLCIALSLRYCYAKAPFQTWTYDSYNTHMEWNGLPREYSIECLSTSEVESDTYDLLILGTTNNETNETNTTTSLLADWIDHKYDGALTRLKENAGNLTEAGCKSSSIFVHQATRNNNVTQNVVWMNTGTSAQDARKVGSQLATLLQSETKVKSCALLLSSPTTMNASYMTELATSLWVGLYKDDRFKGNSAATKKEESRHCKIHLIVDDAEPLQSALQNARTLSTGIYLSKDIVNAPHNVLNSYSLATLAEQLARKHKTLSCHILHTEECQRRGMGAFLGVARGSEMRAQFIHLIYKPRRGGRRNRNLCHKLGIIGKGVMMDTGGYNIKTQMMELMKFDCGGAAAVLGAAHAIGGLEPPDVEVHFCIAACENMINERAVVPGDILTASNGKTIEVVNTDAEGRLTMADALVYVDQELKCEEIVELSTLTGACMVALGGGMAGLWTKNDELASRLLEASATTGEKIWRMPMEEEYNEALKSKIADIKNLGSRFGGAIHAALFLQHFVEGDRPFAHIDMAGPVWNFKTGHASGWGAKLVTEWICQNRSK